MFFDKIYAFTLLLNISKYIKFYFIFAQAFLKMMNFLFIRFINSLFYKFGGIYCFCPEIIWKFAINKY